MILKITVGAQIFKEEETHYVQVDDDLTEDEIEGVLARYQSNYVESFEITAECEVIDEELAENEGYDIE